MLDNRQLLTSKTRFPVPPRKILIVKQRGIGDIILSTPVFKTIRACFRDAWITLVVDHPTAELFRRDPSIDECISVQNSPVAILKAVERIRGRYEVAFDLISTPFSLFLTLVSGARTRVGWAKPGRKRWLFYTHPVDISRSIPAIDANLRVLAPFQMEPVTRKVALHLSEREKEEAKKQFWRELSLDINRLTVIIHPGSLFETKQWFPERYAALSDRLQKRGYQVVITGAEEEASAVGAVMERVTMPTRCLPPTSLREFACFLSSADVAVVNDGGVLHLAQAVGTRTCAVFGSTDPFIWFPYPVGSAGNYCYAGLPCSPCGRRRCTSLQCLKEIAVDTVYEKTVEVVERECFT